VRLLKWLAGILVVLAAIAAGIWFALPYLNGFTTDGRMSLAGLVKPVEVLRDAKGMPYIFAGDLDDAFFAQGFVTAQDRMFQMELTRRTAQGRLAELVGEALPMDRRVRTLGINRLADKQAKLLAGEPREMFQRYADGVNAFLQSGDGLPLEFKVMGIKPEPWRINDSLAVYFFMSFMTSANLQTEVINQMLVDKLGPEKAAGLFPININPDAVGASATATAAVGAGRLGLSPALASALLSREGGLRLGSNSWVVGPQGSPNGKPVLCGDPHLDNRMLPGNFHAFGMFTPGRRAVGAMVPGIPGMVIGRTDRIAVAVTNSYGDAQDLYIEVPDPDDPNRYLEGNQSVPMTKTVETIRIKDSEAPGGYRQEHLVVRFTRRGPIVSDLFRTLGSRKLLSMRWAPAENLRADIGIRRLFESRSAQDVRESAGNLHSLMLNVVFADVEGNIGWQPSGRLPIRSRGGRMLPTPVTGQEDNWTGWIEAADMPQLFNPPKGWVGSANHYAVPDGYPFYYSTYAAPGHRYRRIRELLSTAGLKGVDEHWSYQRDQKNLMAVSLAPVMARALAKAADTKALADILSAWDHVDRADAAAPAIFQAIFITLPRLAFQDELGPKLTDTYLASWYHWEERFEKMVLAGDSAWFDDVSTPDQKESLEDLILRTGRKIMAHPPGGLSGDPAGWRWGDVHRLQMVSPIRRRGLGKSLLGTGEHPVGGSGDTLLRGLYDINKPFAVKYSACLRMVADLGDPEKVTAVLAGGQVDRHFHAHRQDQLKSFLSGEKMYWWFSEQAVRDHAVARLALVPR
jgi:penicillin amidase